MVNSLEVKELLDRSGIVLVKWSTKPGVSATYISDNISQFGYSPDDFYKGEFTDYWKFVHEEDRHRARSEIYEARIKASSDLSRSVVITYRVMCKNGEIRWVEETLLYDKKDGEVSERGFLRDITGTAKLLEHTRDVAEKYNSLLDSIEEFVFIVNKSDRLVSANTKFRDYFQLKPGDKIGHLMSHGDETFYDFLYDMTGTFELEMAGKDGDEVMRVVSNKLSSGEILVIANDEGEFEKLKNHFDYIKLRDMASGLLNQAALENYVRSNSGTAGYRVVMAKVLDYKSEVQKKGFGYAEIIAAKIADVLTTEFSFYDDNIFRSFEDEYVIFTRSPVNNVHIYNTNKRLEPAIKLHWGISKRGLNLRELLDDARCNFREYSDHVSLGSIFGYRD